MILFWTITIPILWLLFLNWTRFLVNNINTHLDEIRLDLADIRTKLDDSND